MLIVVPSSETKRPAPARGKPLDPESLSFPALGPVRERVLDALVATSTEPDAFRRLLVGPGLADEVARNAALRVLTARPALEVYSGTLHEGLDWPTLSTAGRRRAARGVVVASALFGLLRPSDRIPPYRLNICSRLLGLDALEPLWRTVVPHALSEAAGPTGLILDLRSQSYRAMGMSATPGHRTVTLRAEGPAGERIGSVLVKRARGQVARHLLEAAAKPADPVALATVLDERWPVRLDEPTGAAGPWTITVGVGAMDRRPRP